MTDTETGNVHEVLAKSVINAAGPFCDEVRRMDSENSEPLVAASQGVHLVLPVDFYPGNTAMIVPKTSDGRVLFIVPWHGHAIVGTTDTAIPQAVVEPTPTQQEIEFLLTTASEYLTHSPTIDDVQSVFTGIRPLVKEDKSSNTASLSRDHVIKISDSGLITITGGKWTTVRKMAEDCVNQAIDYASLSAERCQTTSLSIHAATTANGKQRFYYGCDLLEIERLEHENASLAERIHPKLPIRYSEIAWVTRNEMARSVEDAVARRTRGLFLNALAAIESAPEVARLMADELGKDSQWIDSQVQLFKQVASFYNPQSYKP